MRTVISFLWILKLNKYLRKLVLSVLLLTAFSALSATRQAGEATTPSEVSSVGLVENSLYSLVTKTTDNTSAVCASTNGVYWWRATDTLAKEQYSTALAALASGMKVSVIYADECNMGGKRLTGIFISK